MTWLLILGTVLIALSGVAKAYQDFAMKNGFSDRWEGEQSQMKDLFRFKFDWWNIRTGWRNKWKNGNKSEGEAFFGSSTFLSLITDAWHWYQASFLNNFALGYWLLGIASAFFLIEKNIWLPLSAYVFSWVLMRVAFELNYRLLHKLNK